MHASLFLSVVLCSVAVPEVLGLRVGDEPPYVDTVKEIIYETNQYLVEKHLDVVAIPKTEFSHFYGSINIVGGQAGNFSTAELVGEPFLNETELTDKTSYYFSIGVGLTDLKFVLQYEAKLFWIFTSSATINVINSGNHAVAVGVMSTSGKGASYKCEVELESINVKQVGELSLTFAPSSIFHWIMEKSSNLILRLVSPFARSVIDSTLLKISQHQEVKEVLTTAMCRNL